MRSTCAPTSMDCLKPSSFTGISTDAFIEPSEPVTAVSTCTARPVALWSWTPPTGVPDSTSTTSTKQVHSCARKLGLRYVDFRALGLDLDVASFTNADHLTTAAGMQYAERLEAACFGD